MIFLILGTQKFQLNRLLKRVDELKGNGVIKESVFAQTGHSDYRPEHYEYVDFLDKDMFAKKIEEADLIITHSGVGSIITALKAGKPVIVFPRYAKYKEHVDDHQLEVAEAFEKKNYVLCCTKEDDLAVVIERASKEEFSRYVSHTGKIVDLVKNFLENGSVDDDKKGDK